jgi:hypothetical protein
LRLYRSSLLRTTAIVNISCLPIAKINPKAPCRYSLKPKLI